MREILISIRPEWVVKILNGEKTVEIRKTMPKCELPVKVYIYCTKGGVKLAMKTPQTSFNDIRVDVLNGKVVGEFNLNKVEKIKFDTPMNFNSFNGGFGFTDTRYNFNLNKSCLTENELYEYLGEPTQIKGEYHLTYELNGYAWHIEDLIIYDTPKELSEFKVFNKDIAEIGMFGWMFNEKELPKYIPLKRAPQSWQYIRG